MKKLPIILFIFIFLTFGCSVIEKVPSQNGVEEDKKAEAKNKKTYSLEVEGSIIYKKGIQDGYDEGYPHGYSHGQIGYDFAPDPWDESRIYNDYSDVQMIYQKGFEEGYINGYKEGYYEGIQHAEE